MSSLIILHRGDPVSPPLCITEADCDEAVDLFARALQNATPELHRLAKESAA